MDYKFEDSSKRFEEDLNVKAVIRNEKNISNEDLENDRKQDEIQNNKKYLPIGSVVMINEEKKLMMIVGFKANVDNKKYDYIACDYPFGLSNENGYNYFNHSQISRIYFTGYINNQEKYFKSQLDLIETESVMGR